MRRLFVVVTIIAATLFISPQLWAKTFYLENGGQIECQSYRQKGGRIFVLINRDTEVEFAVAEVDLHKTVKAAGKEKKKARHKKRAHHRVAAKPKAEGEKGAPAAKPAVAAAPVSAKAKPTAGSQTAAMRMA